MCSRASGATRFRPAQSLRAREAWTDAKLEPIGLHSARHTYASVCIDAGLNIRMISEMMGHASVALTWDRYGHLIPGSRPQAMKRLDDCLESALTATD